MQLEWINHPCQLVEGVSEIFNASGIQSFFLNFVNFVNFVKKVNHF